MNRKNEEIEGCQFVIEKLKSINNINLFKPLKRKKSLSILIDQLEQRLCETNNVKKLAFFHIPKTAGGTITNILKKIVNPDEIYDVISVPSYIYYINEFKHVKKDKTLVIGHYSYKFIEQFDTNMQVFTILRDPIERILSLYEYAKRNEKHYLHKIIQENNYSIEDCINNQISVEFDNYMVRLFSGIDHHFDELRDKNRIIKYGSMNEKMLELAIENINLRFIHVGFQDHLEATISFIKKFYQKEIPQYKNKNINSQKDYQKRYSVETMEFLKEKNKYDMRLYDYFKKKNRKK